MKTPTPNSLINESSPYLQQHAYNPVNWLPYNTNAFEKAKQENKLVLISIGYSACHWCHVMEHESFEDEEVAVLMNKYFINIKVDREERTDVDMLYMQAVQIMTGQGGWPLNCFTLPNGKPIYGGTYFNKQQWLNILNNLSELYQNNKNKVIEYAENLTNGITEAELINLNNDKSELNDLKKILELGIEKWKLRFDNFNGGPQKAPKFPLPNNYLFLLNYTNNNQNFELQNHVNLTLTKMANGGIFDHINGGFARYSVDEYWKVPHFEKMLYDNAQLAFLYCKAYIKTNSNLFKQTAIKTLNFIKHEWFKDGYFFSALDADSEGEEGKYYVWEKEELREILKDDFALFSDYFQINEIGYWEDDKYILIKNENTSSILIQNNLLIQNLEQKIDECILKLKNEQLKRIKPGLDDKSICAWNALTINAFCEGYLSFNREEYKTVAITGINFLLNNLIKDENLIYRVYKNNTIKIKGFLDDYAFTIEALISCYKISCNESYLLKAKDLCAYVLKNFSNPNNPLLFYSQENNLIIQTTEISDNVIPSSNSQMANNFYEIGRYFNDDNFIQRALNMLEVGITNFNNYGAGYSNWAILANKITQPQFDVAIVGNNVNTILLELYKHCPTYPILAVSKHTSSLPLTKDKFVPNQTLIYVCKNKHCYLPVNTVKEAINYFEN
ncbi:MAG: thioredoxin domain-containing protein [Bacteroidetes bacterium]|nr:thioredoxin domain-containing protein [Bacteroidota bacterium]